MIVRSYTNGGCSVFLPGYLMPTNNTAWTRLIAFSRFIVDFLSCYETCNSILFEVSVLVLRTQVDIVLLLCCFWLHLTQKLIIIYLISHLGVFNVAAGAI